jgi:hypothetical protein
MLVHRAPRPQQYAKALPLKNGEPVVPMRGGGGGYQSNVIGGGGGGRENIRGGVMPIEQGPPPSYQQQQQQMIAGMEKEKPAVVILADKVSVQSPLVSWSYYSWSWIVFVVAFVIANGALMIIAGLDMVGVGILSPLLLIIWHFVLFLVFGLLLIWTVVGIASDTLLSDRVRLPLLSGSATLYNFSMTIAYLVWILHNTSLYAEVHYASNSQAYVSYVILNGITFVWFYIVVAVILVAWVVHYNQRKTLELVDMVLAVQDVHLRQLHGTSLNEVVTALRSRQHPSHFVT